LVNTEEVRWEDRWEGRDGSGIRDFDPMQSAEEESGMLGGEGSGEIVGRY
jgi:hypothetical protein